MGKNNQPKIPVAGTYAEMNPEPNADMQILPLAHNKISEPITEITPEIAQIVANMKKRVEGLFEQQGGVMVRGIALAHCQVEEDRPLRLFVGREGSIMAGVFINPEILKADEPYQAREGCLSFPTMPEIVISRYKKIKYRYFDMYGQEHTGEYWDTQAQVFQHEVQHMEGWNIYGWEKEKFVKLAEDQIAKEAQVEAEEKSND